MEKTKLKTNPNKKILFLCKEFPPRKGGLQKSNLEIAENLKELGAEVETLIFDGKEKKTKEFDKKQKFNIERVSYEYKKCLPLYKRFGSYFRDYLILRKKIFQKNPDKIIVAGRRLRKIMGIFPFPKKAEMIDITSMPGINKVKGGTFLTKLRDIFEKRHYKKVDKHVFVSESTKKELYNYYGEEIFEKKEKYLIYRSIDDSYIKKSKDKEKMKKMKEDLGIEKGKKIILSVSRMERKKGIDYVLDTIHRLKKEGNGNFHYIILGDGNYLKDLKREVEKLNLQKQVTFIGEAGYQDTVDYYDLGDIFILPSRRGADESFGRVFAEASARKNAVIGNNSGGVVEVIDDGKTSFLVDPHNKEEIYGRLSKLLKNDSLRRSLGKKGRKKVEETFTKKQLREGLRKIL